MLINGRDVIKIADMALIYHRIWKKWLKLGTISTRFRELVPLFIHYLAVVVFTHPYPNFKSGGKYCIKRKTNVTMLLKESADMHSHPTDSWIIFCQQLLFTQFLYFRMRIYCLNKFEARRLGICWTGYLLQIHDNSNMFQTAFVRCLFHDCCIPWTYMWNMLWCNICV